MDSVIQLHKKSPSSDASRKSILSGDYSNNQISLSLKQSLCSSNYQLKRKPIKKTTLSHKKIKVQRKHLLDHQINEIFQDIIKNFKNKRLSGEKQKDHSYLQNCTRIPNKLINTLYRQNIKNYNPYTSTLDQLEQENSLNLIQKQKIINLCEIGIAKMFIKTKKYSMEPTYSRVNVLIRTYMRDKMCQQIKSKEENYESVIFIPTNELALSFNPQKFPKIIDDLIPEENFSCVINEVNKIISYEYVRYKASNNVNYFESLTGKLILGTLGILCMAYCMISNRYLLPIIFSLGIIWILYSVYQGKNKLQKLVQCKNITASILSKITAFFEKIRNDQIQWKVGEDFYWLEIHYIKRKKKNFPQKQET